MGLQHGNALQFDVQRSLRRERSAHARVLCVSEIDQLVPMRNGLAGFDPRIAELLSLTASSFQRHARVLETVSSVAPSNRTIAAQRLLTTWSRFVELVLEERIGLLGEDVSQPARKAM